MCGKKDSNLISSENKTLSSKTVPRLAMIVSFTKTAASGQAEILVYQSLQYTVESPAEDNSFMYIRQSCLKTFWWLPATDEVVVLVLLKKMLT